MVYLNEVEGSTVSILLTAHLVFSHLYKMISQFGT